jgi:abortive infection bacteriophage resistance protein
MNYQHYTKPWLSFDDQLHHLADNGLIIDDFNQAKTCLERMGYYRLSGYWFPFRERSHTCSPLDYDQRKKKKKKGYTNRIALDTFIDGATFKNAVDLYVFDKKLRLLMLDALERIEVSLRVDISHKLGEIDTFAYLKPELFFDEFSCHIEQRTGMTPHHSWLSSHAALITRSKEEFIRHNKEKYGLPLPIWVACEVWDFGALSKLFAGMKECDQDDISAKYGISNGRIFASWLRSLNYLRNVCAHHSRLWNRNIVEAPQLPGNHEFSLSEAFDQNNRAKNRPFLLFCITLQVINKINPSSSWAQRFLNLIAEDFPDLSHLNISVDAMGTITGWHEWWETKIKNP